MQFKMKHTTVIKHLIFYLIILFSFKSYTQTKENDFWKDWEVMEGINKETVYLNFSEVKNNCIHKDLKDKMKKKNGTQFNLCGKAILLFKNTSKSDTLCYKHINDYKTSTMEDVNEKVKEFRYRTYKKKPKSGHDKLYQAYNNNDIFETYIIEIISEEKFVLYPVIWRNQRIPE